MPGLDPGIHAFLTEQDVDGRDEPGHDKSKREEEPMPRRISGQLVIATHNPGKLAEMRELLAPHGVTAISASEPQRRP